MEHCAKGFGAIGQLFSDPMSNASMGWRISQSSVDWNEVICPQPIRPTRSSYLCDSGSRNHCKSLSLSNVNNRQTEMDILDFILNQDDQDWDSDFNDHVGFLSGSPPVRSSNPVIHDMAFRKLSSPMLSPRGGSSYARMHSPRNGTSCGSSSPFSSKPMTRIEGFSSGNSDSRRVISALA